jgi:opacity protein-like surface antigen
MTRRLARTTLAVFVLASLSPIAHAQMGGGADMGSNRMISIGIGGGVSVPLSDANNVYETGFNGQGFVRFNLHQLPIQPRVDFTFSTFDMKDSKLHTPGASGTGQVFAGLANVQFNFMHSGPVRPYIVAGLGAYSSKTDISGIPNESGSSSSTDFGVNAGGGFVFKLGSAVSGYVEGRIDNVYTDGGFVSTDQVKMIPVTFGLVF